VVDPVSIIAEMKALAARALRAAVLLLLLLPGRGAAERAPYWLVPGGGMSWLPNEFLVKPSRPHVGGIVGARMSPSWAAEIHGTYFTSKGTQPAQPTLGILHFEEI